MQSGQLNSSIRVCERGWITNTHGILFRLKFYRHFKKAGAGVGEWGVNPVKAYKIREVKP